MLPLARRRPLLYSSATIAAGARLISEIPQAKEIAMKKLTVAVLLALATFGGIGVLALSAPPAYANCGGKHAGA